MKNLTSAILTILCLSHPLVSAAVFEDGEVYKISGLSLTAPGDWAKQSFYLCHNEQIIQIYNYYGLFPEINVGDYLVASGTISLPKKGSEGRPRLKIKQKTDIIINRQLALSFPEFELSAIGKTPTCLVKTQGVVKGKTNSQLNLGATNTKIDIDLKEISEKDKYQVNDKVTVNGLLFKTADGYKIIPTASAYISREPGATSTKAIAPKSEPGANSLQSGYAPKKNLKYIGIFLTCWLIFIIIKKR